MLIDAKAEVSSSEILLSKFHMGDQTYVKYTLLDQQEGEKQNENVTATIVNSPASKEKNYDDLAPNAVLYFDQNGNVYYENQVSKRLFANSVIGKHVDTLFLETELGEVLSGIKAYPTKDKEILVRMIIKSKPKLKDGYGRFFELDNNGDIYYRLEYLEQEGMQLVDKPLEKAIEDLDRIRENLEGAKQELIASSLEDFSFQNIVTRSPAYKSVLRQIAQVADTNTTVLISGETGTGKELLANAVYQLSDRSDQVSFLLTYNPSYSEYCRKEK